MCGSSLPHPSTMLAHRWHPAADGPCPVGPLVRRPLAYDAAAKPDRFVWGARDVNGVRAADHPPHAPQPPRDNYVYVIFFNTY